VFLIFYQGISYDGILLSQHFFSKKAPDNLKNVFLDPKVDLKLKKIKYFDYFLIDFSLI